MHRRSLCESRLGLRGRSRGCGQSVEDITGHRQSPVYLRDVRLRNPAAVVMLVGPSAGAEHSGRLTNAFPPSCLQVREPPSIEATGHPGHSSTTLRLRGLVASVSIALSPSRLSGVRFGGKMMALVTSTIEAYTPIFTSIIVRGKKV